MNIKIVDKKGGIEVTNGDMLMYNGCVYTLITKKIRCGYYEYCPHISKTQFDKLVKSGNVTLSSKVYKDKITDERYPIYEITEGKKE